MKKLKPILFSTPMVQAILLGKKNQTRRIIKPQPNFKNDHVVEPSNQFKGFDFIQKKLIETNPDRFEIIAVLKCKYKIGDVLWVRETWHHDPEYLVYGEVRYKYKASESDQYISEWKWEPSIFMPREAARIFLKVTKIRVERLQDISERDAKAEGVELLLPRHLYKNYRPNTEPHEGFSNPYSSYETLWRHINGGESWDNNPWVWVYEFERIEKPN